jgi:transcriptional regulator with XRE-family HTH domain
VIVVSEGVASSSRVVGSQVRRAREARGLTQQEAADGICSPSYLSRIESGSRLATPDVAARLAERLGTTLEALCEPDVTAAETGLRLALQLAELSLRSGDAPAALTRAQSVLDDPEAPDDLRADAAWCRARALEASAELVPAVSAYEDCRDNETDGGLRWIDCCIALSRCYRLLGDLQRAVELAEAADQRLGELGLAETEGAVRVAATLLAAYLVRGDTHYAARLAEVVIHRAEQVGSPTARAAAYWNGSISLAEAGRVHDASTMAAKALALMSEGDDERSLARLRLAYANVLRRSGEPERALDQLSTASSSLETNGGTEVEKGRCALERAQCLIDLGDYDLGERLAREAVELIGQDALLPRATALAVAGRAASGRGDREAAERLLRESAVTLAATGASREAGHQWAELAQQFDAMGRTAAARDAYRAASACAGLILDTTAPTRVVASLTS